MEQEHHKRITRPQFDIWLDDPTTKVYMQCLAWSDEQIREAIGIGGFVDITNNDKSCNLMHNALGEAAALCKVQDPESILNVHKMLEDKVDDDDTDN